MSGSVNTAKGQPTLSVGCSQNTCATVPRVFIHEHTGSVGHDKRLGGWLLEALSAVPGHVLDSRQGTVHDEQVVVPSMSNDDIVGGFDDLGQRAQCTGHRVVTLGEGVSSADRVVGWRGVDGLLDVRSVEVVIGTTSKRGETHHIPGVWAEIGEMVNVEARVNQRHRGRNIIPQRAVIGIRVWSGREVRGRWVSQSLVQVLGEAALLVALVDFLHKGIVEVEDGGEVVQVRDSRGCSYSRFVSIVHRNPRSCLEIIP